MKQHTQPFFSEPGEGSQPYGMRILFSSSSASRYRWIEHPRFTRMTISNDPLIWRLWSRKNSRRYLFIRFRKVAGPTSFFSTRPNLWKFFLLFRMKRIRFLEESLLPTFITLLKSWGWEILSCLVNLNGLSPAFGSISTSSGCSVDEPSASIRGAGALLADV